ncbi:unnamed protein product [Ilex paraguariensis]|uniref:Protein kinase domain-containing protein n=1 Tax=Ilex paraguariensis TaxID=185542 RepID=A0ABC8TR62_9AQUA
MNKKSFWFVAHINTSFLLCLVLGFPQIGNSVRHGNVTDRLALIAFKATIANDPLGAMSSWNESIHFCQWYGVTCGHRHQRVIKLDLSHQTLSGIMSPHIGNLSFLRILVLRNNNFRGEIPPELGRLRRLERLYLHRNSFRGEIPASISRYSNLKTFAAYFNKLVGKIPVELGSLSKLQLLAVNKNNLTGIIPPFGNLSSLVQLFLYSNNLVGGIPKELGQVTKLEIVAVVAEFQLPKCKSRRSKNIFLTFTFKLVISIVSGLLGLTLALGFLFISRFRKTNKKSSSDLIGNSLLKVSYQSLLQATNGFSTTNLIGMGSFGSVYKGILDPDGTIIAVKVLNLSHHGASKSFIAECETLRSIRHRNLVKVLTACSGIDYRGNDFKALVYEFMENGSLEGYLHPNQIEDLEVKPSSESKHWH